MIKEYSRLQHVYVDGRRLVAGAHLLAIDDTLLLDTLTLNREGPIEGATLRLLPQLFKGHVNASFFEARPEQVANNRKILHLERKAKALGPLLSGVHRALESTEECIVI